jgi:hypothetical protein
MKGLLQTYKSANTDKAERLRRMLAIYDAALHGCVARDRAAVDGALSALQATLDYAACPELALALQTLYTRSRMLCEAGEFNEAGNLLASLRATWIKRGAT